MGENKVKSNGLLRNIEQSVIHRIKIELEVCVLALVTNQIRAHQDQGIQTGVVFNNSGLLSDLSLRIYQLNFKLIYTVIPWY